jgi:glycosyltransferase involved in cell wall biosynthesis
MVANAVARTPPPRDLLPLPFIATAAHAAVPRILLDVTRLMYRRARGSLPTGIDRVGQEYVRRFGASARAVLSLGPFSVVLSKRDSEAVFDAVGGWQRPARLLALRIVAKAFLWRWMALDVRGDTLFNTGHTGLENPHYAWWLRRQGARVIVVIHDLIPITHPQFCRPSELRTHQVRMRCAARVSAGIVANSQHTLAGFRAFCDSEGLPVPPCRVALLGSGMHQAPAEGRPIAHPYFVMLGTLEPRKNHLMILEAWQALAAAMGPETPRLVVIGQPGWNREHTASVLARCAALGDAVIVKAQCSDAECSTWLRHARALLFPSFAEGYGMPLVEALSLGVPVIASDLPAFREIVGDTPEYAAPGDTARWEALVRDYAPAGSAARAAQVERMGSFQAATWAQHFATVDELLGRSDPGQALVHRCPA